MSALLVPLIHILVLSLPFCSSSFLIGSAILPQADDSIAIGYDIRNDTILLFGGFLYRQQFTMFRDNNFIDRGPLLTKNQKTYGYSQHYSQLNDHLWIILNDGESFLSIDTRTYAVAIESSSIPPIPINVNDGGCLTSTDDYLIVVGGNNADGGYGAFNTVQMYHFIDAQWLSNVASLSTPRTYLSCVIVNNNLYAIAGRDSDVFLNTIEVLDISNSDAVSSALWSPFGDTLSIGRYGTRAAVYGTDIYVVGGAIDWEWKIWDAVTNVDIIHTMTGICEDGEPLSKPVACASCIVVRNTLFVFGGYDDGSNDINKYQYLALPTPNPTSMPTNDAASDTSNNPTYAHVNYATTQVYHSTMDPTDTHVNYATTQVYHSTMDLTDAPTKDSTMMEPTATPSNYPTISTTIPPTMYPTYSDMCYPRGPCEYGYMDRTNGNVFSQECGIDCVGGSKWTGGDCNCACVPESGCSTFVPIMDPTKDPTIKPSIDPTKYPTLLPTIATSFPPTTELPSSEPSRENEDEVQEMVSTVDSSSQEQTAIASNYDDILRVPAIIGGCMCICCILSLCGAYHYWKRMENRDNMENMKNTVIDEDQKADKRASLEGNADMETMKDAPVLSIPNEYRDNNVDVKPQSESVSGDDDILEEVNATARVGVDEYSADSDKNGNGINMEENIVDDNDDESILEAMEKTMGSLNHNEQFVIDGDAEDEKAMTTGIAINGGENDNVDPFMEDGAKRVRAWLESLGFSKYYDVFIRNGFDSMDFVKEINDVKDLDGIGIPLRAHQLKIVNEIKQLNK